MSLVEFKDVYKIYKMGEVTINAVEGVSFNIEQYACFGQVWSGAAGRKGQCLGQNHLQV